MNVRNITLILTCLAACALAVQAVAKPAEPARRTPKAAVERITRGERLVGIMGCNDCHTPFVMGPKGPAPDPERRLSGHPATLEMPRPSPGKGPWMVSSSGTNTAWAGPWGVSFTSNLTPDLETGLGRWTETEFVAAMRTGRHRGTGRPILPPMPIASFGPLSDREIGDIFAYLKSLPPISNPVPAPVPPSGS